MWWNITHYKVINAFYSGLFVRHIFRKYDLHSSLWKIVYIVYFTFILPSNNNVQIHVYSPEFKYLNLLKWNVPSYIRHHYFYFLLSQLVPKPTRPQINSYVKWVILVTHSIFVQIKSDLIWYCTVLITN